MKKLFATFVFGILCIILCASCANNETASPQNEPECNKLECNKLECKVIERVVSSGKARNRLHVLTSDGSIYHCFLEYDSPGYFAQKGDTIEITADKNIVGIRFAGM